jgi:hypothetical protein
MEALWWKTPEEIILARAGLLSYILEIPGTVILAQREEKAAQAVAAQRSGWTPWLDCRSYDLGPGLCGYVPCPASADILRRVDS